MVLNDEIHLFNKYKQNTCQYFSMLFDDTYIMLYMPWASLHFCYMSTIVFGILQIKVNPITFAI